MARQHSCSSSARGKEAITIEWYTLKKTAVRLPLSYANTFTNNLRAENIRIRTDTDVHIALDLNKNLRTRQTTTNSYLDARKLADGKLSL